MQITEFIIYFIQFQFVKFVKNDRFYHKLTDFFKNPKSSSLMRSHTVLVLSQKAVWEEQWSMHNGR